MSLEARGGKEVPILERAALGELVNALAMTRLISDLMIVRSILREQDTRDMTTGAQKAHRAVSDQNEALTDTVATAPTDDELEMTETTVNHITQRRDQGTLIVMRKGKITAPTRNLSFPMMEPLVITEAQPHPAHLALVLPNQEAKAA
jgi:hypothetical protein